MYRLFFTILFASASATANTFIIDGRDANREEFPAIVSLEIFDQDQMSVCTASFISDNTLITAAHCVYKKNVDDIIIPTQFKIKEIIIHDAYSRIKNEYQKIAYDMALIVLTGSKNYHHLDYSIHPQEGSATIIGFGGKDILTRDQMNQSMDPTIGTKRIGKTIVNKISPFGRIDSDQRVFKTKNWYNLADHYSAQLKEKISVSTRGDSGGPLIQNQKIIGVISGSDVSQQSSKTVYSTINYFAGLHSSVFNEIRLQAKNLGSTIR